VTQFQPSVQIPATARPAVSAAEDGPIDAFLGDATGLMVPAHIDALKAGGARFLTQAFRAFGSISPANSVARITRYETCPGGSTGQKLFLSVEYEHPEPGLHADLFLKFSRDFNDKIRDDRGKHEMAGEVRFAALSRLSGFPVKAPTAYFADYDDVSKSGLLITERIRFGTGGVEPHRGKCLDHEIADPLEYYREIVRSLARVSAAQHAPELKAEIAARFPDGPLAATNGVIAAPAALEAKVDRFAAFVARAPQLFPANIATPAFFEGLRRDAVRFDQHQAQVDRFLQADTDYIALCHWNANIDNAWFWREPSGALRCGLMDWGHAGKMNVGYCLWGALSSARGDILEAHLGDLLALFIAELRDAGGPALDLAELQLHMDLNMALAGLSYFLDCPERIQFRLPQIAEASGPLDPMILARETVRNQLHISATVLNLWQRHDIGGKGLERVLRSVSAAAPL
jgi:hypothetical protein